jgi:hypothetical protein
MVYVEGVLPNRNQMGRVTFNNSWFADMGLLSRIVKSSASDCRLIARQVALFD